MPKHARKHLRLVKPRLHPTALDNVPARFRGAVVTKERARSKSRRQPTENQVRALRFIWQRGELHRGAS